MPKKKYIVDLTDEERAELLALTAKGTVRARKMKRAQILLLADEGQTDAQIMSALKVSRPCVERVRQRFVAGNLARALNENPRPGACRKLSDRQEARVIAEACTPAPAGRKRWTVRLLTERVVALQVVETVSRETIRRVLKKTRSSPGKSVRGVFQP